ncbi:MAG: histidine phosphatase family protein [Oscillospiraceae bacterium]
MRTYKIFLIRHGLTSANFEGKYIGNTDLDLCEKGATELVSLMDEFEYPNVGRVYTSPLKRAIQTARMIYPYMTPVTVADLREYSFGEFENKTMQELDGTQKFVDWVQSNQEITPDGGEKMSDFKKRVVKGLDLVIKDMMKDQVSEAALVTHAGVIMSILALCGLPKRLPLEWAVESGKGYTLMINAQLWGNTNSFEVFTPIPYGSDKDNIMLEYQRGIGSEE